MLLEPRFRHSIRGTIWIRTALAFAALFAILAARSASPHLPGMPGDHSTVSADSAHDQRPRFDSSNAGWSAPTESFLLFPPTAESTHLAATSQLFSTIQTKGFHFNRPPPAS